MKKKTTIITLSLISFIIIGFVILSTVIGFTVFNTSMKVESKVDTGFKKAEKYFNEINYDLDAFESAYTIEEIEIESTLDGHTIPGNHISKSGEKNRDTIIMAHGVGGESLDQLPYC